MISIHSHSGIISTYIRGVDFVTVLIKQLYDNGVEFFCSQHPLLVWENNKPQITRGHNIKCCTGLHEGVLLQVFIQSRKDVITGNGYVDSCNITLVFFN